MLAIKWGSHGEHNVKSEHEFDLDETFSSMGVSGGPKNRWFQFRGIGCLELAVTSITTSA